MGSDQQPVSAGVVTLRCCVFPVGDPATIRKRRATQPFRVIFVRVATDTDLRIVNPAFLTRGWIEGNQPIERRADHEMTTGHLRQQNRVDLNFRGSVREFAPALKLSRAVLPGDREPLYVAGIDLVQG